MQALTMRCDALGCRDTLFLFRGQGDWSRLEALATLQGWHLAGGAVEQDLCPHHARNGQRFNAPPEAELVRACPRPKDHQYRQHNESLPPYCEHCRQTATGNYVLRDTD